MLTLADLHPEPLNLFVVGGSSHLPTPGPSLGEGSEDLHTTASDASQLPPLPQPWRPPTGLLTSHQLPIFCQLILKIGNFLNYVSGPAPAPPTPMSTPSPPGSRGLTPNPDLDPLGQPHGGR